MSEINYLVESFWCWANERKTCSNDVWLSV